MNKQIKYVKGNVVDALLNNEVDYLIHCCNAQGKYASGVAGEIRQRIPEAYEAYMELYNTWTSRGNRDIPLGDFNISGSRVINLVGQRYYGRDNKRYVNYGALAQGFSGIEECFRMDLTGEDVPYPENITLGLPKIGAGLAGGDWEVIEELIEFLLVPYFKEIRIYTL